MRTIKDCLDEMSKTVTEELSAHTTEPDEYTAVKDIELAIHEARKVFERTKNIDNE